MKRTKKKLALLVAKVFNSAVLVRQSGDATKYDIEYIIFPDGREESYRTGACLFFRNSSKENVDKVIEKDKEKLEKKLKSTKYIKYKGLSVKNYLNED